jgi:hypothetical protein
MAVGRKSVVPGGSRRDLVLLGAGFLAALLIRVGFLVALRPNYDTASWQTVVDILERGGRLYEETPRYNYSPLWAGVLWGLAHLAKPAGLSLARAVSLLLLAADVATAALVWRIAAQTGKTRTKAGFAALLFFANPLSVMVSSHRVMFDGLAVLFLLLALFFARRKPVPEASVVASLAVSLLAKHITWFHPLLFARRRNPPRLSGLAALFPYAVFLLSFVPFWSSWSGIRAHVFGYRGLDEPYGTEPLRFVRWLPPETTVALFVLAALAAVWMLRDVELGRASLLLFLVILLATPGICPYYFVWPVALGALYPSAGYLVYTTVLTAFFIHSPDVLAQEIPHLPGWWGAWWAVAFWLLWEIRSLQRTPAAVRRDEAIPSAGVPRR